MSFFEAQWKFCLNVLAGQIWQGYLKYVHTGKDPLWNIDSNVNMMSRNDILFIIS